MGVNVNTFLTIDTEQLNIDIHPLNGMATPRTVQRAAR